MNITTTSKVRVPSFKELTDSYRDPDTACLALTTRQLAEYLVSPRATQVITGIPVMLPKPHETNILELTKALDLDFENHTFSFGKAYARVTGVNFVHKQSFKDCVNNYTNLTFLAKLKNFKGWYNGWATLTRLELIHLSKSVGVDWGTVIPIFSAYLKDISEVKAEEPTKQVVITTESNKTIEGKQNMFEKLKNQNVEAAKLAGKLTLGKAANELVANALVARLPWYQRLFSSALLRDSSVSKLVTANLAVVLATHFGKQSKELELVTDAMLQDAMVELVRDSDAVTGILNQLTGLAGNLVGETK